ncbi:MAG: type III pantothenate kinase [Lachnospiraceae bacterium]|nr:type III pantothenate kinase [Lachnospiraceae bacterium]
MEKKLLLGIDVGNTNITFGVFQGKELLKTFRMTTKMQRTSDEFGVWITSLLQGKGFTPDDLQDVIVASVVPGIMYSLNSGIIKYLNRTPIVVSAGMKTGLRINMANPKELGADRVVDCVAGYELYGSPVMVIDFGTATTYDLVLPGCVFETGITSPGIRICANALWNETAKLPEIAIEKPESILARDTTSSMQAGLVYGCIGQTEYIIKKVKEEAGLSEMKVVATGGLGRIISEETDMIDVYDPDLTLKGLQIIYERQPKRKGKA